MSSLTFEPHAVQQVWHINRPLGSTAWMELFGEYLRALAAGCQAAGPCVIGHIKLLGLFGDKDYLRMSVVDAGRPPTVTGAVPGCPDQIEIVLNVLVYGIAKETLAVLTSRTAVSVAERWGGAVDEHCQTVSSGHAHSATPSDLGRERPDSRGV